MSDLRNVFNSDNDEYDNTQIGEIRNIEQNDFIKMYSEMCPGYIYQPAIMDPVQRIVVLGDIHGDYKLAINMLLIANLISCEKNNVIRWIGKGTYVVQIGDQVDRCRPVLNMQCDNPATTINDEASDIKILELFTDLHYQAMQCGGAVISLLGNHEILNALGQINYVSEKGRREFDGYVDPKTGVVIKNGDAARIHAFAPGNQYGKFLGCTRYAAVIIGSNLFVHAGIIDGLINEIGFSFQKDIKTVDMAVRLWLMGLLKKKYIKNIIKSSKTSMFWTRILGSIPPGMPMTDPKCIGNIGNVLKMFKVGKIYVGHTPQSFRYGKNLNSTCDDTVWRVDNGSSSAFHRFDPEAMKGNVSQNRRPQVLQIINDGIFTVCDVENMEQCKVENMEQCKH